MTSLIIETGVRVVVLKLSCNVTCNVSVKCHQSLFLPTIMKMFIQLNRNPTTTRKELKMLRVERQGRRLTFRDGDIGASDVAVLQ